MTKAVDVFIPIFELVAIFLCIGIIFILVSFSTKMIKDKMHDIGILKAIGTQSKTIGRIFGLQIILIAILTILMSTFGYYYFIDMANDVLVESLRKLAPTHVMLDLDFLTFKLNVVNINIVLILLLGILSLFIPMLKIRKIKPVKIIKTKEYYKNEEKPRFFCILGQYIFILIEKEGKISGKFIEKDGK